MKIYTGLMESGLVLRRFRIEVDMKFRRVMRVLIWTGIIWFVGGIILKDRTVFVLGILFAVSGTVWWYLLRRQ